ncbi:hypothetical protein EVAR_80749_1 [Eumeta japonica]|uniref:Uncharacterized protein n=1 Tax=Eumeta variegata TaxID=151549 RepID=A0A4C1X956_EUMVA|nr:hypothetical protein EVAR_80749_1 [Eumeta japonica]
MCPTNVRESPVTKIKLLGPNVPTLDGIVTNSTCFRKHTHADHRPRPNPRDAATCTGRFTRSMTATPSGSTSPKAGVQGFAGKRLGLRCDANVCGRRMNYYANGCPERLFRCVQMPVPNAPKSSISEIFNNETTDGASPSKGSPQRPRVVRDTPTRPRDTHSRLFGQVSFLMYKRPPRHLFVRHVDVFQLRSGWLYTFTDARLADGLDTRQKKLTRPRQLTLKLTPSLDEIRITITPATRYGLYVDQFQVMASPPAPMMTDTIRSHIQFGEGHCNGVSTPTSNSPTKLTNGSASSTPSRGETDAEQHCEFTFDVLKLAESMPALAHGE